MLMKKHNAINYHAVREAVVVGILRVGKGDGETNLVDLLMVITGQKIWDFCYCFFLLNWSNSKVLPVAHHHGITSHASLSRSKAL
jgi:hypothetical protein